MAKKKTPKVRVPKYQPPALLTYQIVFTDAREPEHITCHNVTAYGGACEFTQKVPTPQDPEGEWVTVLVLPVHVISRVQLLEDGGD
jgi:hypothetical protein